MNLALEKCFSDSTIKEIVADPFVLNKDAIRLYLKMGFRFRERSDLEKEQCEVYAFGKEAWLQIKKSY